MFRAEPTSRTSSAIFVTRDLVERGFSKREIAATVATGRMVRVRPGWYASSDAPAAMIQAVRVGGSLGCISGAAQHGLWSPDVRSTHVAMAHGGHLDRTRRPPELSSAGSSELVLHWDARARVHGSRGLLPVVDCLAQVTRCQPPDVAFAVVESALRQRLLTERDRGLLEARVAASTRHLVRTAGRVADSGSESLFRYRLNAIAITVASQVEVPGVGRVDFVIGDRLVVEIDSAAHHGGAVNRLRHLQRDATLTALGFICLRFDYVQVMNDWESVQVAVLAALDRGDHLAIRR